MGIIKPPIGNIKKFESDLEHIPQSHFVKKTEREAVTKHIPVEEPFTTGSFKVGDNEFHITQQPTSSYNPNTFQIETSYQSVLDTIENGKDTDLVAMPVGEVRKLQERIRILEREVMKSKSGKEVLNHQMLLDIERQRIQDEQERIKFVAKHKQETELRKEEIKRQIMMSKGWDKMFKS